MDSYGNTESGKCSDKAQRYRRTSGTYFSLATRECIRNVRKIPFSKFVLTLSSDPLLDSAQLSEYSFDSNLRDFLDIG